MQAAETVPVPGCRLLVPEDSLEKPLGLEWCTGVKTLGIHFSCDQGQIMKQNFHERVSDFQKTINLWSLRALSLFGKVTIVK